MRSFAAIPICWKAGGRSARGRNAKHAPVAQLDRASDYESEGRTFESFRARHSTLEHAVLDKKAHILDKKAPFPRGPFRGYAADLRPRVRGGAISASAGMSHSRCNFQAIRIVRGRLLVRMSDAR